MPGAQLSPEAFHLQGQPPAPYPALPAVPPEYSARALAGTPGLSSQGRQKKDVLTAQPGLAVSCWGSRSVWATWTQSLAGSEALGVGGEAPEVPAEPSCQEVSTRDSSALCLEFTIYQG